MKANNRRDVERNKTSLESGTYEFTIVDGVMLWDSNGSAPFDDMVEAAQELGYPVDREATANMRTIQEKAAIRKYIKNQRNMSDEQKAEQAFERRAAFGPGETVVDVFSGETFRT